MASKDGKITDELGLAKARYEYCLHLYEREQGRRETIERKAQFHLSLITAFLGLLLLRLDILQEVRTILEQHISQGFLVRGVYAGAIAFALALIIALVGVLMTIKARSYNPEYPANPSLRLFNPKDGYFAGYTEAGFYRSAAMNYAVALESDSHINNRKSGWLALASYSLLIAILAFAVLFGSIAYLQLT